MAYRKDESKPTYNRNPFENKDDFEEIHSAELSRLQYEKQLYQKRMVDSSSRSLRLVEESRDVACKTEEELDRQEETLLRTERTLDKINGDMDVANRQISSLKSIWGTIGNYFRKAPQSKPIPQNSSEPLAAGSEFYHVPDQSLDWDGAKYDSGPKDVNSALDSNLDRMMSGLTELKGHAMLLGETMDRHDDIIERVTYKASAADQKIEDSDKKIRQILHK